MGLGSRLICSRILGEACVQLELGLRLDERGGRGQLGLELELGFLCFVLGDGRVRGEYRVKVLVEVLGFRNRG